MFLPVKGQGPLRNNGVQVLSWTDIKEAKKISLMYFRQKYKPVQKFSWENKQAVMWRWKVRMGGGWGLGSEWHGRSQWEDSLLMPPSTVSLSFLSQVQSLALGHRWSGLWELLQRTEELSLSCDLFLWGNAFKKPIHCSCLTPSQGKRKKRPKVWCTRAATNGS